MEVLRSSSKSVIMCPIDQNCSEWARRYFGYCVCSTRDGLSMGLGLISVISWCVAEIPQIITNYKQKSAEGISITFLLTWIVGDLFNLSGCMLEPATLPTQYYTAVLYLATTLVLTAQAIYYGHIYPRLKSNKRRCEAMQAGVGQRKREHNYGTDAEEVGNVERYGATPSSPVPLPLISYHDAHEELYFMSARSLSVSRTPTAGSFMAPTTPTYSDVEQQWSSVPLLSEVRSSQSAPLKIKTMLCVVFLVTFFIGSSNNNLAQSHKNGMSFKGPAKGLVLRVGSRLLQAKASKSSGQETLAAESGGIGSFLGWAMAVVYLGGRLPQIYLNIRRGNGEGLNPLMFVFALVGNVTYTGSILVNSLDWSKIRLNMPWLVDAAGCVLLDTFIVIQYFYFRYRSKIEARKYTS